MDGMNTQQVNQYIELIAGLVEATAKNGAEAARIVRECKMKEE